MHEDNRFKFDIGMTHVNLKLALGYSPKISLLQGYFNSYCILYTISNTKSFDYNLLKSMALNSYFWWSSINLISSQTVHKIYCSNFRHATGKIFSVSMFLFINDSDHDDSSIRISPLTRILRTVFNYLSNNFTTIG